jgi:hypothetical protein
LANLLNLREPAFAGRQACSAISFMGEKQGDAGINPAIAANYF